jgi:hypothetical protein
VDTVREEGAAAADDVQTEAKHAAERHLSSDEGSTTGSPTVAQPVTEQRPI